MSNIPDADYTIRFAQCMLQDCIMLPKTLLENYHRLPMADAELLLFLRISGPLLRKGSISPDEAAAELKISREEALPLLESLLPSGVLERREEDASFHCRSLFRFLYECWLDEQRLCSPAANWERPLHRRAAAGDSLSCLGRLYRRFEAELGRTLKFSENEQIRQWLEDDGIAAELIEEALRRAVLQDKGNLAYMNSILRDWCKKGLHSLEQVQELDVKPERKKKTRNPASKAIGEAQNDDFLKQLSQIQANLYK
ncbi:MAG: DnaD domain protein [Bacillota bacterium]|nr:DnaD domain protein [Bacillota bacterium]